MTMDVGFMQRHWTSLGDLPHLGQVLPRTRAISFQKSQPRAGDQAAGKLVHCARLPEAVVGGDVLARRGGQWY